MKQFKIIPADNKQRHCQELFIWLSTYTSIVSASNNYCTVDSLEHGTILETSLFTESELNEMLYPHEAIQLNS